MENKKTMIPIKKITGILDILICLLLFISSLYKGGFYKEDSLFINLVICLLGIVCLSVKIVFNISDNRKIVKSKLGIIMDIAVMLMPSAYFLPVVFGTAASKEAAIFESIRYVNFAIIYFIVRSTSNKKVYLTLIAIIGIILAVLGIDELTYRVTEDILNPISINYLSDSGGKLSSTIQYANITALIMLISSIIVQDKLVKNLPNLCERSSLKFKFLVICEMFSLILLQSAVVLTTSRMNILLMVLTTVVYSIYCLKLRKSKSALMLWLMLIAALGLVASIDSYLLIQNNFMVIFTYLITLLVITVGVMTGAKFSEKCGKIKAREKNYKKKIVFNLALTLSVILILALLISMPTKLRLNDNSGKGTSVTRNIYYDLTEKVELDIAFNLEKNSNFNLHIYEVDGNFNKKILASITETSLENNRYLKELKISNDTEKLMIEFSTKNSNIAIEHFKINEDNITLSYMFIPDNIMFRLKDTLISDSNNSLRFTYYKDAIKLFNTSKLFGIGGEGFKARYQEVQTEYYVSSEVHSSPIQILVEAGIVGLAIFITICVLAAIIVCKSFKKQSEESILYLLILFSFVITSIFDLVLSFGIMIYIFAVILGLVIGEYKNGNIDEKDKYELDNKSSLGMLKIATLSISLMALIMITVYSINIYRASMIVVTESAETLEESYERVGLLENKVALDKYNIAYLNSLLAQYDKHIDLLNEFYMLVSEQEEKNVIKNEIDNYVISQKQVADNIIEYEYYNKYAIERVARCYFKHYMSYAHIYNKNFKNDEIAYVFYVGYAIKLTDRLKEIGKVNNLAHEFACDIYEEYIPAFQRQNKILNSKMLSQAIEDMTNKLEALREVK